MRAAEYIEARIIDEIPRKYHDIESDSGEFLKLKGEESLFISGGPGTGKTVLSCSIGKKAIRNSKRVKFISYPAFIMKIQSSFRDTMENPFSQAEYVGTYEGILIIDDLGAEKLTEYVRQITYYILNEREQRQLATIITSNFSLAELDDQLDSRISSRIAGMCRVIKLTGEDRRLKTKKG